MSDHDRDLQRRIRERAYTLWQEAGSPTGRDQEFWHRALELEQVPAHGAAGANGGETAPGEAWESAGSDPEEASTEDADAAAADAQSAERAAIPWWRRLF
jgi:hypothetical protein